MPVSPRSRPNIQAAMLALSELNRNNWKARFPSSITLKDVDLRDLSFQGYCFDGLDFSGCLLGNSDFSKASMQESFKAHNAYFEEAILRGVHFETADLKAIHVDGFTDFSDAYVENMEIDGATS